MAKDKAQETTNWYELKDKIQRNLKLAHDVEEKTKKLGMKRLPPGAMGANLSDICIDLEDYVQLINQFLEANIEDKRAIGEILIEMRVCLNEIKWHYSQVKRTLERVIDYCYDEHNK
ncbi:MAG: hypothetical protein WC369_06575 [Dehalococcoidales bacterium]|jgi:hypothetical protein